MQEWSEKFNIPLPDCGQCGTCCCCASPTTPHRELLEKAEKGDQFACDFLRLFVPYENIEDARKLYPDLVDKVVKTVKKNKGRVSIDELRFYKCRYYEGRCTIYEDRPELCRVFPGDPFTILCNKCSFSEWAAKCKEAYNKTVDEINKLKQYKEELEGLKFQKYALDLNRRLNRLSDKDYRYVYTLKSFSLVSPGASWIKFYY